MLHDSEIAMELKLRALNTLTGGRIPQTLNHNSHATLHAALMLAAQEINALREKVLTQSERIVAHETEIAKLALDLHFNGGS